MVTRTSTPPESVTRMSEPTRAGHANVEPLWSRSRERPPPPKPAGACHANVHPLLESVTRMSIPAGVGQANGQTRRSRSRERSAPQNSSRECLNPRESVTRTFTPLESVTRTSTPTESVMRPSEPAGVGHANVQTRGSHGKRRAARAPLLAWRLGGDLDRSPNREWYVATTPVNASGDRCHRTRR